jgi:thiol-disulfide isomerase/thioredoxin
LTLIAAVASLTILSGLYFMQHNHSSSSEPSAKDRRLAPDFTLPQLDGQKLTLSSYRGKVVLLDFWATWCVPCREEIPRFVELQKEYGDRGLQIIGVSMDDSADPVGPFYQQFHMNYPVVMGDAKIGEMYGGVLGLPIAFLIDRDGRIYAKHIGATNAAIFEKEINSLLTSH